MIILFIFYVLGYLIGAIPTGFICARLNSINDLRQLGSGSTGATNTARILGSKYFFLVFVLDFLKAYLYLVLLHNCNYSLIHLMPVGFVLQLGNIRSIFLGFKGGKGVATAAGIISFFDPYVTLVLLCAWLISFMIWRIVGIASVISGIMLLVVALLYPWPFTIFYALLSCNLLIAHKTNIWNHIMMPFIKLGKGGL